MHLEHSGLIALSKTLAKYREIQCQEFEKGAAQY